MAGSEGVSGSATDESLSSRLQWLRQRREALQDKLSLKNNELKSLCIEEAELTGVLPPEIPLEPGESPPNFRKRLATSITYPQNIINKLKTNGAVSFFYLSYIRGIYISWSNNGFFFHIPGGISTGTRAPSSNQHCRGSSC